jgi:hypothetical protein
MQLVPGGRLGGKSHWKKPQAHRSKRVKRGQDRLKTVLRNREDSPSEASRALKRTAR